MRSDGIKIADLIALADQCRTRPGSEWIDVGRLAEMLMDGSHTRTIKATAPDNIAAAIEQAKAYPEQTANNKTELAQVFGICRKTLDNWCKSYGLILYRRGRRYDIPSTIRQMQHFTQNQ